MSASSQVSVLALHADEPNAEARHSNGDAPTAHPIGDGAYAIFDAQEKLVTYSEQWLCCQGDAVREAAVPGLSFTELLEHEIRTHPFSAFSERQQKAWRKARGAYFKAADGRRLEFGSRRKRRRALRCTRLHDGGTLMSIAERDDMQSADTQRLDGYLAASGTMFFEIDLQLRLRHACAHLDKAFAAEHSAILGRRLLSLLAEYSPQAREITRLRVCLEEKKAFRDQEISLHLASGDLLVLSLNGAPFNDSAGQFAGFRCVARDVTAARELQRRLARRSVHDELTGLFNRSGLQQALDELLADPRHRQRSDGHAVCYMDVDQFQVVNDTCGYEGGDALLTSIAKLVVEHASDSASAARVGGDEFAVLLPHCDKDAALACANRIFNAIRDHAFTWNEQPFRVTASIGIVHSSSAPASATEMLRAADSACYAAKDSGHNRVKMFSADDSTMNLRQGRMHWIARINSALQENRLSLYVQPIAPTRDDNESYLHYELLLRLKLRDGRIVSPGEFLPAAEQYNLATAIDRWVVEHCIQALRDHPLFLDHLHTLSVNLSGLSIADKEFKSWCMQLVKRHKVVARKLCFEVTETAMVGKMAQAAQFIVAMRELGCRFALDDFGAGLSSFGYLKDLDVDYLKIDGQFVKDLDSDAVNEALVRAIHQVAQAMGKKTIAEFVETQEVRTRLADIGVDLVQGYGIGRPVPIEEVL